MYKRKIKIMSENKNASSGIGLGGVLFLIFLVLKLAEIGPVQYWSWWAVTSPLWVPALIVIAIFIAVSAFFNK
jgi:hypothetical protein